jgi:hypothetical protein
MDLSRDRPVSIPFIWGSARGDRLPTFEHFVSLNPGEFGKGRTVQVGIEIIILCQVTQERGSLLLCHLMQKFFQQREMIHSLFFGQTFELGRGGVGIDHEIEELTRRGLTSFVHPVWNHLVSMREKGEEEGQGAYSLGRQHACMDPIHRVRTRRRDSG